jgi:hypothetical protein
MLYTVYQITNKNNGKIYVGVHKTKDIDNDPYMGSGKLIKEAIKKHGKESFDKYIIAVYNEPYAAYEHESILVNEDFVNDPNTYNLTLGGNMPPRTDNTGKKRPDASLRMKTNNPSAKAKGESHWSKDNIFAYDKEGNKTRVKNNDPRILSGELILHSPNKGRVGVRDSEGNRFQVSVDDPRYISGELVSYVKGVKLTCPHCGFTGGGAMHRWHFDNCKKKA